MLFTNGAVKTTITNKTSKPFEEENDDEDFIEIIELLFGDENGKGLLDDDRELQIKQIKKRWVHLRNNWNYHIAQLVHEGYFQNEYRMNFQTFEKLCHILHIKLCRQKARSRCLYPITVHIIIAVSMRWLTGTDINGCRHIFRLSRTECYRSVKLFLKAVLTTDSLKIRLPTTQDGWRKVKKGFWKKSKSKALYGVCGAIDGLFLKTTRPRHTDVVNVRAYYSGHYEHYGINCQAMCDAYFRFLFFGIVAPGSTNDNVAYERTGDLKEVIESLELGDFIVGDAAYTLTEHLLIPFTGTQKDDPDNYAFNFYLSQMRIRIEMAFGLLVKKFSILKKPMKQRLRLVSMIVLCCATLHNFIINKENTEINDDDDEENEETNTIENEEDVVDVNNLGSINGELLHNTEMSPGASMVFEPTMIEEGFEEIAGVSNTRMTIVKYLKDNNFKRPLHNLIRNNRMKQLKYYEKNNKRNPVYEEIELEEEYFHPV